MIDVSPWPGLVLGAEIEGGNRNQVWHAHIDGLEVAVRRSRRSAASLAWELELITFLSTHDFVVPHVVLTADGQPCHGNLVVQQWIHGREPACDADWLAVAKELQRLHARTANYPQRPGCCAIAQLAEQRRSADADLDKMDPSAQAIVLGIFAQYGSHPTAVIHGDPWEPNLRICPDGRVGLLDWDESRVDVTAHDLSPLGVQVLGDVAHAAAQELSHAWEAANGWTVEPEYARSRLEALLESRPAQDPNYQPLKPL